MSANSTFGPGARAVAIPKGSKVSTRAVCITELHPTLRFFAMTKGSSASRLRVEVMYEDLGGSINTLTIGWLRPTGSWRPTAIVPTAVNIRAAAVAFRFSAEDGEGTWLVDDVYVDPWKSF